MKKTLLVASSVLSVLLIAGMVALAHNAASGPAKPETETTASCPHTGVDHQVVIKGSKLSQETTRGALCDTLTITNEDNRLRLMAFGEHEHHQAYDGITSKVLAQGESLRVTMNKTGQYKFHDHLEDEVAGYFIVTK